MRSLPSHSENKFQLLDLLVLIMSFYVLGALIIDALFNLPEEISRLLLYIDNFICLIFFIDFVVRFYQSQNKISFMKWGWIDLLSSLPMIDFFRAGRILRLIRILRIVRAFKTTKKFIDHVYANKAQGAFASISTLAVLLIIFSAIGILQVETDPNSNIKTAEDAIWWAYVTVTTVGYGDKFPVTTEGRIIAAILMTAGVGLFGTFTAYISSWFISDNK